MNRENLQRMADHIRTVPQEKFEMVEWRSAEYETKECGSIGCVIGHCTILDSKPLPRLHSSNHIDFGEWSEDFTGLDQSSDEWEWCFSSSWHEEDNTPDGAALRIEWLLKNGLPTDWKFQMEGALPLCYIHAK